MARFVHSSLARFSCLCFLYLFVRSLADALARSLAHALIRSLVRSFRNRFARSSARSFVRSLVRSSRPARPLAGAKGSRVPFCREMVDNLPGLQRATARGLRRYSPPPAPQHASLHPFGPCPHLVIHSSVLSGPMACPAAAGFARAALGRPRPPLPAVARRSAAGCQVRLHDLSEPLAIQPRGDGEARAAR